MFFHEIKTPLDVSRCGQVAALLECSAYPKPGNVHRLKDHPTTRYEHFLIGASIIGKPLENLAEKGSLFKFDSTHYSRFQIGKEILQAVEDTATWQTGGNINLGVILLQAPLAATAGTYLHVGYDDLDAFRTTLQKIIQETTPEDSLNLYKALQVANPGGMGEVEDLDIHDESSMKKIQEDQLNLHSIFSTCADRDAVAREWITSFELTFKLVYPFLENRINELQDINLATIDTFLHVLSKVPDTLIMRKAGPEAARVISEKAREIIIKGGITKQKEKVYEFDAFLQEKKGLYNPGTTADLIAAGLMVALLRGLRI